MVRFDIAEVFAQVATKMRSDIEAARSALAHPGLKGTAFEEAFRNFLREYLPANLEVSTGVLVDSSGRTTRQLDIIISDRAKAPILYRSADIRVLPVECVYAVIEVKAYLDSGELDNVLANMESVRSLQKLAFQTQSGLIRHVSIYGEQRQIWPVMYFVFAYDSINLVTLAHALAAKQMNKPLDHRIDTVCVLDQGVICNCPADQSVYTCVPVPGSLLAPVRTKRALLLFYTLIASVLNQVWLPTFQFASYLGQMTFGINEVNDN